MFDSHDQESCVINGGNTTQHYPLQKGALQGVPTSGYLIIRFLEIVFILIKNDSNFIGIEIFEYCYFYTAYTAFFLKGENTTVHFSEKSKLLSDCFCDKNQILLNAKLLE